MEHRAQFQGLAGLCIALGEILPVWANAAYACRETITLLIALLPQLACQIHSLHGLLAGQQQDQISATFNQQSGPPALSQGPLHPSTQEWECSSIVDLAKDHNLLAATQAMP